MSNDPPLAVALTVNGAEHAVAVRAGDTLLTVLRETLQLTGSKRGCNQGVCGACTVLADGRPVRSCLTLAAACPGREIETVEGLMEGRNLSAVQAAMVEAGAVQCGYCTPGIVIALTALLRSEPAPNRDEVREALSGNLCRCSGYVKIVDAAMSLAGSAAP